MSQKKITIKDFQAGIGTLGQKRDKVGSARFTKNLDPFEDQDYVTLSRRTTKVSSTTIDNLPLWMEDASPFSTDRYAYDLGGSIYKVTSSDVVSSIRTVSGATGEGLKVFDDYLYYMLPTNIGRYGRLSGTPAFNDSLNSWWDAAISDLRTTGGGTGQTYTTGTSIVETATHRQTFAAGKDPLKEITIDINDTGDDPTWTVTVHDSEDNVIGTKTIAFASITTGDNVFTFATPLRLVIGNNYHFHVTTSTTTGAPKVTTNVASDLEGAEFIVEYGVLLDAEYHPAVVMEDLLIIGNKRYLATFNQSSYDPCTIAFDAGYEVRTIIKSEEYIVAECYKGSSVLDSEEGKRYYWDGIQTSFNFSEPIGIGAPSASTFKGSDIIGVYGFRGSLFNGKTGQELTHEVPKLTKGKYVEVYPSAIANYENRILVGYAGLTDDTTGLEQGVYEYGGQTMDTTIGFNMPFVISTGNTQGTNQKVSLVKVISKDIYIGSRDNTNYQLDKVTLGDLAATSGTYESLILDNGSPEKEKQAFKLKATFNALTAGQTVTLAYKINRATDWTSGSAESTVGATETEIWIGSRFREIEFKFTIASSEGTFVKLMTLEFEMDSLSEEK